MNVDQILEHVYKTTYDLVLKTNLEDRKFSTFQAVSNATDIADQAISLARQTLVVSQNETLVI